MKQSKSSKSKSTKRKTASVVAVLLAVVQTPAMAFAAVPTLGQLSLTNLVATSLMSDYSRAVAPSLVETRFIYTDLSCKINECFVLECGPLVEQTGVMVDTSGDATYADGYHATTVRVQTASTMTNRKPIVVAINGGVFNMTTNQPWGAVVKDGVEVQGTMSSRAYRRNFSGTKKDGTPVVTLSADYPQVKFELQNAVGPYDAFLAKDGSVVTQKDADQKTYSPWLGVDVHADEAVFSVMIDGRQFQYSTGATLKGFAQLMKDMGVVQAGNPDAGGSATLFSHNYGNSTLLLCNKPSGDKERPAPSSLLLMTRSASI